MTYVCITGNESNPEELRSRLQTIMDLQVPLLAELRLDYLSLSPSESFRFLLSLPEDWAPRLVLTQRLSASGPHAQGRCRWDIPTWQNWWREVMQMRPWYAIDLDWLVVDELASESLSWPMTFSAKHALFSIHGGLDEIQKKLPDLMASAQLHGVGVKIAAPVKGARDLARLARLRESLQGLPLQVVVAMGQAGRLWRWSKLAGNISYFVMDQKSMTAQGQDSLQNVLPYLKQRSFPYLYMLWSTDPLNRRGEVEWNRIFEKRQIPGRYFNLACASEDFDPSLSDAEKQSWVKDAVFFMEKAGVLGASITRPFKEVFAQALGEKKFTSINTLYLDENKKWQASNTDGDAVVTLLQERNVKNIVLLGSGGTAQGLRQSFQKQQIDFTLWKRDDNGALPALPDFENSQTLISTWPSEYQDFLVQELERHKVVETVKLELCIDAQLKLDQTESPLALWCQRNNVPYLPGSTWWFRQASMQEQIWGLSQMQPNALQKLVALIPRSKSETIRALWLGLARKGKTTVHRPSLTSDVFVVKNIVQALGAKIIEKGHDWIIEPPATHKAPSQSLDLKDCGAAARILLAWSTVIQDGVLQIQASPQLQRRPFDDFFDAVQLKTDLQWPLRLACGQAFPTQVSMATSSQFATGFLLAAAARLARQGSGSIAFALTGEAKSFPYLALTAQVLVQAGYEVDLQRDRVRIEWTKAVDLPCEVDISLDASAMAYFEVLLLSASIDTSLPWQKLAAVQGDAVFPQLLEKLKRLEKISLADCPDLAPPLWAAALLSRRVLHIIQTPQLRWKESDRSKVLVDLANALGAEARLTEDGFYLDAKHWQVPLQPVVLSTHEDHRIAMAIGVVEVFYPMVQPDRMDCVQKSFPDFLNFAKQFKEILLR
jgi:3-phosphoshikimate 1-carboxyvinyltransferase